MDDAAPLCPFADLVCCPGGGNDDTRCFLSLSLSLSVRLDLLEELSVLVGFKDEYPDVDTVTAHVK